MEPSPSRRSTSRSPPTRRWTSRPRAICPSRAPPSTSCPPEPASTKAPRPISTEAGHHPVFTTDRPELAAQRAEKIRGVHFAVVVDNKDEVGPFKLKVKYPWLPPGDEKTYWARVATPMGGNDRGN